ncbi:MAG: DUF362 domain-containing protein [Candidatus Omnitrophica bacterium]|nr:DUF362 domain-containing protein [Candidatus Omnitrophota bacterium]
MKSSVSIIKCASYEQRLVETSVRRAVDSLGGIAVFIRPGSRVLVKPNLLMAKEPEFGIDTHPEVIRAVIRILKEIKCNILVGDGPSVWGKQIENVDEVYRRSGAKRICDEENVEMVKFDKRKWHGQFPLTSYLNECDHLINIPKFKTHELTLLTGAIKNLFGLVCGTYKTELHKNHFEINDFSRVLVDIYEKSKPALTVVDGIVAMEGDGPATSGKLRNLNLLLAGSDCVAIDTLMSKIIGVEPMDVITIKEAVSRKLGNANMEEIEVLGERFEDCLGRPFLLPSTSFARKKIPLPIVNIIRRLVKYYPFVYEKNCIRCQACMDACPKNVISMRPYGMHFDYKKCIACFCCQEACPASAIKVKKSLVAKLIGL